MPQMRFVRFLLPAAMSVLAMLPSAATAAEPETRAQAEDALQEAQQLLDGRGVRTGRELTPTLARLAAGKALLPTAERREATGVLARPTDGAADPQGDGYTVPSATWCTASFCVHYVTSTADAPPLTDADADTIPDYVETMAQEFETVRSVENGAGQMGWRSPKSDGTRGGDARTDVYIKALGASLYGYAAPEENAQTSSAYQVMDNDYAGFPGTAAEARQATAAHEYNHVLQFAYDTFQDPWMLEATATWAEEQVFPGVNDYVNYLGTWATCTTTPLTSFNQGGTRCQGIKPYGSAVWNHWLSARSDRSVIRSAWEGSVASSSFAPAAYETAITGKGGAGFADEFSRFSAGTAEWRAPGTPFPDAGCGNYPDVERRAGTSLAIDGAPQPLTLDHTTFALVNVPVDGSKARAHLSATFPAGVDGGIALVGRTGTSATGGTVTSAFRRLPSGGTGELVLDNPGQYGRITAVLVNNSTANAGYVGAPTNDYAWTQDAQAVSAQVTSTPGSTAEVSTRSATAPSCSKFATPPSDISSGPAAPPAPASQATPAPTPAPGSSPAPPPPVASTPAPGSSPAPPPPVASTPAPALAISSTFPSPQKLHTVMLRGVLAKLRCNRACRVKGVLRLDASTARRLKLPRTVGTVTTRLSRAGTKSFRIKLTSKARKAFGRQRSVKLSMRLVVTGSDAKTKISNRRALLKR